jgi:transcription-repair coupling factor (superfamily II helicase)
LISDERRTAASPALDAADAGTPPHAEVREQRAVGLWRLATRRVPITVMPVAAALLRVERPDFYRQLALHLRLGKKCRSMR